MHFSYNYVKKCPSTIISLVSRILKQNRNVAFNEGNAIFIYDSGGNCCDFKTLIVYSKSYTY